MGYSCAVLHRPSMLCRMKWSCMGHTLILNGFGAGKCCATNEKKRKRKKRAGCPAILPKNVSQQALVFYGSITWSTSGLLTMSRHIVAEGVSF